MGHQQACLPHRLLAHYGSSSLGDRAALDATALRGESTHMRWIYAHQAAYGTMLYEELVDHVLQRNVSAFSLDPLWLARLAGICALQDIAGHDRTFAVEALRIAVPRLIQEDLGASAFLKLQAELLFADRDYSALKELLSAHQSLRREFHGYLGVDSASPFIEAAPGGTSESRWLDGFNRQFVNNGLLPVSFADTGDVPFNRVRVEAADLSVTHGPMVSVILTTYKPDREDVLQSARSILGQTWQQLELLVVDDASPPEYSVVLREVEELDSRVRVLRMSENGGTYIARNAGIAEARGEFVTGQDADDWSHPQRIEVQAMDLLESPEVPGNQVYTVNMTEDLVRIRTGYSPFIPSAPTLMVRTSIMRELGGYLPARKAADNELRDRVGAYTGTKIHLIKLPLIFMRILPGSLSRADFRAGWQHPARRAFWSAYKTWHSHAEPQQLRRGLHQTTPIAIPARFTEAPKERNRLDVVFAADWCEFGNLQASMVEEIEALKKAGYRVGILHMENALHISRTARTLCKSIQDQINVGDVTQIIPDEDFHDVGLLLVRTPEVLQFTSHQRSALTPNMVAVVADHSPDVQGRGAVTYLPHDCAQHTEESFGRRPLWLPGSTTVRTALRQHLPSEEVSDTDYLSPFDSRQWRMRRTGPRGRRPVVGAWTGSHPIEWPKDPTETFSLLPTDGSADVRLYGASSSLLRSIGETQLPFAWTAFPLGSISRKVYYRSLDVFLYYPRLPGDAPERSVREALAAGCLVILPEELKHIYGEAAIYAVPENVARVIDQHLTAPALYREQTRRAVSFGDPTTEDDYVDLIQSLTQEVLTG